MYDVIIVGKGLIGSAAARYLSELDGSVALIGPDEPQDWQTHNGVFASHYDQGRITRILDADWIWGALAKRSLAAYGALERRSGIRFHHAVSGLYASATEPAKIAQVEKVGQALEADFGRISAEHLNRCRPYFDFPTEAHILWEHGRAGYVNPRSLAAAQAAVVAQNGATIIRETACALATKSDHVEVTTTAGTVVTGRKILLAMGAYTNLLLTEGELAHNRKAHMILRAEIDSAETHRLRDMPTLIYTLPQGSAARSTYMLPPVRYPDGKTYVKLGITTHWDDTIFDRWDDIVTWFQSDGFDHEQEALKSVLHQVLPDLTVNAYITKPCILTYTQHGYPTVDQIDSRVYVAAGGNGAAAKSSDAIGHLAALLLAEREWPAGFERDSFKAVYA